LKTLHKYTPAEVIRPRPDWEDRMRSLLGYVCFEGITTSGLTKEAEARTWRNVKNHRQLSLRFSYCVWKRANNLGCFLENNYAIPSLGHDCPSCRAYNALTTYFQCPPPCSLEKTSASRQLSNIGCQQLVYAYPLSNCLQLIFEISITSVRCAKPTNSHCGSSASSSLSWL
jgi:hypothetical protein